MRCKRLIKSLQTTDVNVARAARWNAVAQLKARIEEAKRPTKGENDPLTLEALEWREALATAQESGEREAHLERIGERAYEVHYSTRRRDTGNPEDDEAMAEAKAFYDLATGQATPLDTYLDRWLAASGYTERTKADARTAMEQFRRWCLDNKRPAFIEKVSDRVAADFRDWMVANGVHPTTTNKKLSALRQYWAWLDTSIEARPNPWMRKSLPKIKRHRINPDGPDARERPFTDDEVRKLLAGQTKGVLADFMRVAALSGMRPDEIGRLRIRDCQNGVFTIRQGKTPAAVRDIPIHSGLRDIIRRLIGNRESNAFLFRDLPDSGWDGNRVMALSKRFATYRRRLGIDDKRPGARRSKVNFYSFRRWFATKVEEAGQRENVAAAVMGHEKGVSITFSLYSQAELTELKRKCVEAVKLPKAIETQR